MRALDVAHLPLHVGGITLAILQVIFFILCNCVASRRRTKYNIDPSSIYDSKQNDAISALFHILGGMYYLWKYYLGREGEEGNGSPIRIRGSSSSYYNEDRGDGFIGMIKSMLRFDLDLAYVDSHQALQSTRAYRQAQCEYVTRLSLTTLALIYVVFCAALMATGVIMFSMQSVAFRFARTHFTPVFDALDSARRHIDTKVM